MIRFTFALVRRAYTYIYETVERLFAIHFVRSRSVQDRLNINDRRTALEVEIRKSRSHVEASETRIVVARSRTLIETRI